LLSDIRSLFATCQNSIHKQSLTVRKLQRLSSFKFNAGSAWSRSCSSIFTQITGSKRFMNLNQESSYITSNWCCQPWSDIPKLDLLIVINYDVPRLLLFFSGFTILFIHFWSIRWNGFQLFTCRVPQDYIHRVSGRGGFALNLVTQVGIALSTTDDGWW
jgi:hypothetical protein